jgi:bloom syndrome protein
MALTATAQNKVQDDIIRSLRIGGCHVLRQSFNRPNLHYEIRPKMKGILNDMASFIGVQRKEGKNVPGIVYCGSRDKCELIAKQLREEFGLRAHHYHAGMSKGDRRSVQERWQENDFEIIVATVSSMLLPGRLGQADGTGSFRYGVSGHNCLLVYMEGAC